MGRPHAALKDEVRSEGEQRQVRRCARGSDGLRGVRVSPERGIRIAGGHRGKFEGRGVHHGPRPAAVDGREGVADVLRGADVQESVEAPARADAQDLIGERVLWSEDHEGLARLLGRGRARGKSVMPPGPAPPPGPLQNGVLEAPLRRQTLRGAAQGGKARRSGARVERAWLVESTLFHQQGVPVYGADERPHRDSLDRAAGATEVAGGLPDVMQPPQLLVAGAAMVGLRDCQGPLVAIPYFGKARLRAGLPVRQVDAHGFCIGVAVTSVPASQIAGVGLDVGVEVTLAREIVVDPDEVRGAFALGKEVKVGPCDAEAEETGMPRVVWSHPPLEKV